MNFIWFNDALTFNKDKLYIEAQHLNLTKEKMRDTGETSDLSLGEKMYPLGKPQKSSLLVARSLRT